MKRNMLRKKAEPQVIAPPSLEAFPNFTKKEIFTQGDLINELLDRYIKADKINFDYLKIKNDRIKRIYLIGDGIDYPVALFASYNFEVLLDIISVSEPMGEFLSSNPIIDKSTLVVMIGENSEAEKRVSDSQGRLIKIIDFGDDKNAVSLNYKTLGKFDTASFNLKLVALSLLALYLGEKNKIITELYIKIAVSMLKSLKDKIAKVLSKEFIINELAQELDFSNLCLVGTNVDSAIALYGSYIFSSSSGGAAYAVPLSQLTPQQKDNCDIIALASSVELCDLIGTDLECVLKIVTNSVEVADKDIFYYDETIPLLNPVLSSVVLQLIAYSKLQQ